MTRTRRKICIFTAIILCVLTLSQALCSVSVHYATDSGGNTRFFAVSPVFFFRSTEPSQALADSKKVPNATWIRNKESVILEQDVYKLFVANEQFTNTSMVQKDAYEETQYSYEGRKCTSYYMRI